MPQGRGGCEVGFTLLAGAEEQGSRPRDSAELREEDRSLGPWEFVPLTV